MNQNKARSLKKSLFFDWVMLILVYVAKEFINKFPLNEVQFALDDKTISHPYKGDTIKMEYLLLFCIFGSLLVITFFQMKKKSLGYDYNQAIVGLIFSLFITGLIGNILEGFAGRLRPDFLSICQPDLAMAEQIYNSYNFTHDINYGPRNLFNSSICTGPPEDVLKERTSFPSGHSYISSSLMSYLALYIAGQIHLFDKRCYLWKFIIVSIPYIIAITVAISRVYDYRHHWQDVTVGGLIGFVCATLSYFYYYPSLSDPKCDVPYQYRKLDKKNDYRRQEDVEYN